jgi:hypothetical protein
MRRFTMFFAIIATLAGIMSETSYGCCNGKRRHQVVYSCPQPTAGNGQVGAYSLFMVGPYADYYAANNGRAGYPFPPYSTSYPAHYGVGQFFPNGSRCYQAGFYFSASY